MLQRFLTERISHLNQNNVSFQRNSLNSLYTVRTSAPWKKAFFIMKIPTENFKLSNISKFSSSFETAKYVPKAGRFAVTRAKIKFNMTNTFTLFFTLFSHNIFQFLQPYVL